MSLFDFAGRASILGLFTFSASEYSFSSLSEYFLFFALLGFACVWVICPLTKLEVNRGSSEK